MDEESDDEAFQAELAKLDVDADDCTDSQHSSIKLHANFAGNIYHASRLFLEFNCSCLDTFAL